MASLDSCGCRFPSLPSYFVFLPKLIIRGTGIGKKLYLKGLSIRMSLFFSGYSGERDVDNAECVLCAVFLCFVLHKLKERSAYEDSVHRSYLDWRSSNLLVHLCRDATR